MSYSSLFKALGDAHRLKILHLLLDGEKCACVLINETGLLQSGLSYHMKILCDANIVNARQEAKWTHYSINSTGINLAINILQNLTNKTE